jgi:hypothetical protein
VAAERAKTWEKDTETHQQRRITLDDQTLALLRAYLSTTLHRASQRHRLRVVGGRPDVLPHPDGSTWLKPDSVSTST